MVTRETAHAKCEKVNGSSRSKCYQKGVCGDQTGKNVRERADECVWMEDMRSLVPTLMMLLPSEKTMTG